MSKYVFKKSRVLYSSLFLILINSVSFAQQQVAPTKKGAEQFLNYVRAQIDTAPDFGIIAEKAENIRNSVDQYDELMKKNPQIYEDLDKKRKELNAKLGGSWTTDLKNFVWSGNALGGIGTDYVTLWKKELAIVNEDLKKIEKLKTDAETGKTILESTKIIEDQIKEKLSQSYSKIKEGKFTSKTAPATATFWQAKIAATHMFGLLDEQATDHSIFTMNIDTLEREYNLDRTTIEGIIASLSSNIPKGSVMEKVCEVRATAAAAKLQKSLDDHKKKMLAKGTECEQDYTNVRNKLFSNQLDATGPADGTFKQLNPGVDEDYPDLKKPDDKLINNNGRVVR